MAHNCSHSTDSFSAGYFFVFIEKSRENVQAQPKKKSIEFLHKIISGKEKSEAINVNSLPH